MSTGTRRLSLVILYTKCLIGAERTDPLLTHKSPNLHAQSKFKMSSQPPNITASNIDVADASLDQEKNIDFAQSTASDAVSSVPFDQVATKRLLRKLDLRLIPFLALIYL